MLFSSSSSIIHTFSIFLLLLTMTQMGVHAVPVNRTFPRRLDPVVVQARNSDPKYEFADAHVRVAARMGGETLLGYLFVPEDEAEELNNAGTLTAIPAKDKPLGEGVYLSPRFDTMFPTLGMPKTYWQCSVAIDESELQKLTMYYLAEEGLFYKPDEINSFLIRALRGKYSSVFLLAQLNIKGEKHVFMKVPSVYLERSPKSTGNQVYGKNTLGLKVHCVPLNDRQASRKIISWQTWPEIKNWPSSVKA